MARGRQSNGGEDKDKMILDLRANLTAKEDKISRLKEQVRARQDDKKIEERKKIAYFHDRKALTRENRAFKETDKIQKEKLREATVHQRELKNRINELEFQLTDFASSPGNDREQMFSNFTKRRSSRSMIVEPASSQLGGTEHDVENESIAASPSYSALKTMYDVQKAMSEKSANQSEALGKENEELKSKLEAMGVKLKMTEDGIQAMEENLSHLKHMNHDLQLAAQNLQPRHERLIKIESKLSELIKEFSIGPSA